MDQLNNLMYSFSCLIILILILLLFKEYPSLDTNNFRNAFGKIY